MVCTLVKDIVEEMLHSSLETGKVLQHPDGRTVKVTKGQYWGK